MMLIMQIIAALGVAAVIYAVFGVFTSGNPKLPAQQKIPGAPLAEQDFGKEQKIQHLQDQIAKLESQLEQSKAISVEEKSKLQTVEEKETEFSIELKRREEWVAKAESELAKAKAESLDLNNKFVSKEKELQEEFTKNVNLTRQVREIKAALEAREVNCRLKEDQLQAQQYQSESQLKSISEYLAVIAEFKRKEKISEWVPKQEFNQLNAEYTKLEKELEASQERLKSFASEIAHLRPANDKKVSLVQEPKLPVAMAKEIKPQAIVLQAAKPVEEKIEEAKVAEEIKIVEEDMKNKTGQTEEKK